VRTSAFATLTSNWANACVIAARIPFRSWQDTRIFTGCAMPSPRPHSTSMRRSASSLRMLGQSAVWTASPWPRVTNPTTASPGSGLQQRANRTIASPMPWITMPFGRLRG